MKERPIIVCKLEEAASQLANYSSAINEHSNNYRELEKEKILKIEKLQERIKALVIEKAAQTELPNTPKKQNGDGNSSGGVFGSGFLD